MSIIQREYRLCEECGTTLTETASDFVCPSCGLVAAPKLVESSPVQFTLENKSFGTQFVEEGERKSIVQRTGSYLGFYGNWNLSDIRGKRLKTDDSNQFRRLKRINDIYSQSYGKERLYRSLYLLNIVSGVLELPDQIKEDSALIIRNSYTKIQKIRIGDLVAASIYLTTRMSRYIALRTHDLLNAFLKEQLIISGKHLLYAASQIRMISGNSFAIRSTTPEEYLERVIQAIINDDEFKIILHRYHFSNLEFGILLRQTSRDLLSKITKDLRGGRNPYALACATVAGADLLIAKRFGRKRGFATQRLIARVTDCREYTMREHFIKIIKTVL